MEIFGAIIGIFLGVGIGFIIAGSHLDKSNNFGDSKGTFATFTNESIVYVTKQNRVKKNTPLDAIGSPAIRAGLFEKNKNETKQESTKNSLEDEINNFTSGEAVNPFKPL